MSISLDSDTTLWRQLNTTHDVDSDGVLHITMHFVERHSGHHFTVSVSGFGQAKGSLFVDALRATAQAIACVDGVTLPGSSFVPATQDH